MSQLVLPEDPIIRDMLPDFVESWRRDITIKLPHLIDEKNQDDLFRFGHTLRGSGRQFNLPDMSELGTELQDMARAGQWDHMPELRTRLLVELERVVQFLLDYGIVTPGTVPGSLTPGIIPELPSNI